MWNPELDERLMRGIASNGLKWTLLAQDLNVEGIRPRHVRDRWHHVLNPAINHGPFTEEESGKLEALFTASKGSWAVMALSLPGRTDLQVKNHWMSLQRRKPPVPNDDLQKSLKSMSNKALHSLFDFVDAPFPAPSTPSGKRNAGETTVVAKRVKTASPAAKMVSDSSIKFKMTFGKTFVAAPDRPVPSAGATTLDALNAMLGKQPDARKQKWDGLGKL